MNFPKKVFKSYDIRGLLDEITPDLARAVAAAVIRLTNAKTIVIGRDMRETSQGLMDAAIRGAVEQGANVKNIGLCSSSMFNYAAAREGVDAGIMITASHNPSEYNGMKAVRSESRPISTQDIWDEIQREESVEAPDGDVIEEDILNDYLEKCIDLANIPDISDLYVIVDFGNGMGPVSMIPLLERIGIQYEVMYEDLDARFPNHEANPAKVETLNDLIQKIKETGADFGIATDGDADRIGFVDGNGDILRGDQILALLAQHKQGNGDENIKVTAPVNVGWALDEYLNEIGLERIESKIGWSNVSQKMRDAGSSLGGETSSHFFFKEFSYREAIDYAFLLILAEIKRTGKTLAELAAPLRSMHNSGEVNVEVADKDAVLQDVKDQYSDQAKQMNDLDGIRFDFDDWWFIMRPSNTEPVLRLTVEARSEELMKEKVTELSEMMK